MSELTAPRAHPSSARAAASAAGRGSLVGSLVDAGVVVALAVIAALGFLPVYEDDWTLVAAAGGALVGAASALAAARFGLNLLNAVLVGIALYFLLGTPLALPGQGVLGSLPSLGTLADLARGPILAWRDAVTLTAPLVEPSHLAVLPYFTTAVASFSGVAWLTRLVAARPGVAWLPSVALLGPLVVFAATIFVSTDDSAYGVLRGGAFAAIALIWLGWRRTELNVASPAARRSLARSRAVGTAAMVAVAAVLTTGVGIVSTGALADRRLVAREEITPPFDPLTHTSPLAGFREYSKLEAQSVLFEVEGLREGDRLTLAKLDSYSGKSWQIAPPESGESATGTYTLSGRGVPPGMPIASSATRSLDITVRDYADIWLPTLGVPTDIDFTSGSLPARGSEFRYNAQSSAGLVTTGLVEGDGYSVEARVPDVPVDGQLDNAAVSNLRFPTPPAPPASLIERMQTFMAGETSPYLQLKAIENAFVAEGYLSHGTANDTTPSRAGHGLDRMQELFDLRYLVGDEEQYASAMALMVRQLGYPAKVVMGFEPERVAERGPTQVLGEDVTAWVEVPFDEFGWVAFDPTPERTDVPVNTTTEPESKPKAQVRQPPQTQEKPDELLTSADERRQDEEDPEEGELPAWAMILAAALATPLLLLGLPLLLVALLRRRRRHRRERQGKPAERAAAAWSESLDRYSELGYAVPARLTRTATAAAVHPSLVVVAERADRAVFGAGDPGAGELAALWGEADTAIAAAQGNLGFWAKTRAAFRLALRGRRSVGGQPRRVLSWGRGRFGVHRGAARSGPGRDDA